LVKKKYNEKDTLDFIDKITTLLEILNEKIDKKIESVEKKIDDKLEELKKEVLKEEEKIEDYNIKKNLESLNENIKKIDEIKDNLNLIKKLESKYNDFEKYLLKVIKELDDIKTELKNLIFNLKDLYEFENKLDKLIIKINNWDKFFNIEEIEYNQDRINLIREWILEQLKKGHDIEKIKEELIKNGYSAFFVHKVLNTIKNEKE